MADNPLWCYSAAVYGDDAVSSVLLYLQNSHNLDVNMLLCCCWLGDNARLLTDRQMDELVSICRPWQQNCVAALRAARRFIKAHGHDGALYKRAKQLELDAERMQQQRMFEFCESLSLPKVQAGRKQLILGNLHTYTHCLSASLWDSVFQDYERLVNTIKQ